MWPPVVIVRLTRVSRWLLVLNGRLGLSSNEFLNIDNPQVVPVLPFSLLDRSGVAEEDGGCSLLHK